MAVGSHALLAALALLWGMTPALGEDIVSLPNLSYRTGPFAATGIPLMNGQRDYMTMINERDGGVNGVRLGYEECETGHSDEKGEECYDRTRATGLLIQPGSPGIALRLLPRSAADGVPLLAPGYGFSPMSDGRLFKWAFNPPATNLDGVSMILEHISGGSPATLRGRKVALLYLDTPDGAEPVSLLESFAGRYGFAFLPVPVSVREMQNQAAKWRRIADEDPDFVLMWGWGAMNGVALAEAIKARFPMNRFIGIWWSGHDGDLKNFGEAAKGYRSLSWNMPLPGTQLVRDIRNYVVDAGKTDIGEEDLHSVLYQRGLLISMFVVEAIRIAQENFNAKIVNAEQLRWGFENLRLPEERLREIGVSGMVPPFSMSCEDHSGHAGAWMLEWDGEQFVPSSDLLHADGEMIAPILDIEAAKFTEAHRTWPVNDACRP